jgi:DNA-binding FrmR family transcriptional regulator
VKLVLYDAKTKNRIKRAEGQLRGILKMMEDEKDCKSVITQLTASRSAIDKAIAVIVSSNLEQCIVENAEKGIESSIMIEEAVNLLVKSR